MTRSFGEFESSGVRIFRGVSRSYSSASTKILRKPWNTWQ